jgi:hypothetical protein
VSSGALAGEKSVLAPDGRTRYDRSHSMLVSQDHNWPLQMNHECVAHIWLTACEECLVVIPSEE